MIWRRHMKRMAEIINFFVRNRKERKLFERVSCTLLQWTLNMSGPKGVKWIVLLRHGDRYRTFVIKVKSFYIVAPCILRSSVSLIYQQMYFVSVLENIKLYIKTSIKIAATCFGLRPSSGSLRMSLAKVAFIKLVKVRHYGLCGCVTACYINSMVVCVLCAVSLCTAHSTLLKAASCKLDT